MTNSFLFVSLTYIKLSRMGEMKINKNKIKSLICKKKK